MSSAGSLKVGVTSPLAMRDNSFHGSRVVIDISEKNRARTAIAKIVRDALSIINCTTNQGEVVIPVRQGDQTRHSDGEGQLFDRKIQERDQRNAELK